MHKQLIMCIALPVILGMVSGFLTKHATHQYTHLILPSFAPPRWIYGIVWYVLYVLMGIASYMVWSKKNVSCVRRNTALKYYGIQLAVNFIWPLIFFNLCHLALSFAVIMVLMFLVFITTYAFYKVHKTAAYLMIPYCLWIVYAAFLNHCIYLMNCF